MKVLGLILWLSVIRDVSAANKDKQRFWISMKWPSGAADQIEVKNDGRGAWRQVLEHCEGRVVDCDEHLTSDLVKSVTKEMVKRGWPPQGVREASVPLSEFEPGWQDSMSGSNCENVDRVSAERLTAADFMENYVQKSRPLIIINGLPGPEDNTNHPINWNLTTWRENAGEDEVIAHISDGRFDNVESTYLWNARGFGQSEMGQMIQQSTSEFEPELLLVRAANKQMKFKTFLSRMNRDLEPVVHYLEVGAVRLIASHSCLC